MILKIACPAEDVECALQSDGEVLKDAAELGNVEFKGSALRFSLGDLKEVADFRIDPSQIVRWREGVLHPSEQGALNEGVVDEDGIGKFTVSSGTSRFLEVGFYAVRYVKVENQSDIGFVDSHAEGIGGDHDAGSVFLPGALDGLSCQCRETCVIVKCGDSLFRQCLRQVLRFFSRTGIDDGAAGDALENVHHLFNRCLGGANDIAQVRTFKTHAEHLARGVEPEFLADVLNHLFRSSGSQRQHGHAGEHVPHGGDLKIGGSEVVAPL